MCEKLAQRVQALFVRSKDALWDFEFDFWFLLQVTV